jgi:hypothetical protein
MYRQIHTHLCIRHRFQTSSFIKARAVPLTNVVQAHLKFSFVPFKIIYIYILYMHVLPKMSAFQRLSRLWRSHLIAWHNSTLPHSIFFRFYLKWMPNTWMTSNAHPGRHGSFLLWTHEMKLHQQVIQYLVNFKLTIYMLTF